MRTFNPGGGEGVKLKCSNRSDRETHQRHTCFITTRKVWGKVIFSEASVILFTEGGGGSAYGMGDLQGISIQGESAYREGLHPVGSASGGLVRPTPHNQKSAWYATYWNSFLLSIANERTELRT